MWVSSGSVWLLGRGGVPPSLLFVGAPFGLTHRTVFGRIDCFGDGWGGRCVGWAWPGPWGQAGGHGGCECWGGEEKFWTSVSD